VAHSLFLCKAKTGCFVSIKKPKGKERNESAKGYSRPTKKFGQPIESFFKCLNDQTKIQIAGSLRSTEDLLLHYFGKLSFVLPVFCSWFT
jgi:hypothetical protein